MTHADGSTGRTKAVVAEYTQKSNTKVTEHSQ